jgi:lipid-A-disaccharide synthase
VGRFILFKGKYATLMNVAADAEAAPEFIQTKFTPGNIARAGARVLDNPEAATRQIAAQNRALDAMGRGAPPASDIAAEAVLAVMKNGGPVAGAAASSH